MSLQHRPTAAPLYIPQPDLGFVARAGQQTAIGAPSNPMHPFSMATQGFLQLSAGDLPDFDSAVIAGAGERGAVRRKCQFADQLGVRFERPQADGGLSVVYLPEANTSGHIASGQEMPQRAPIDGNH